MVNLIKPLDLNDALDHLSQKKMIVFAGGTDLMIRHRALAGRLPAWPYDVLYIADIQALKEITIDDEQISIGACVTMAELLNHPKIPHFIKRPLMEIGSPAIRNTATLGGNIGNASPAGDALTMLVALDALILLRSKRNGERKVPIREFLTGPKQTSLKEDELIIKIMIPNTDFHVLYYKKVGARNANAITKLSLYALTDQHNRDIRIAFGSMGPKIIRDRESELALLKADPKERVALALERYGQLLMPVDDVRSTKRYRKQVALNLLKDFMEREGIHEKTEG